MPAASAPIVPPLTIISAGLKPEGASLNVNVSVAVCPAARLVALLVMLNVGALESKP